MFESASQNAWVLTEGWVVASLFCPNCGVQPISWFAAYRPVADFLCDTCREEYELKSQKARLGARVVDGAFAAMSARLAAENNPNLLVMRYDRRLAPVIPGGAADPGPRRTRATCTPGSRLSASLRPG